MPEEEELPKQDAVGNHHGAGLCVELGDGAPSADSQGNPEEAKLTLIKLLEGLARHSDENLTIMQQHADHSTLPDEKGSGDGANGFGSFIIDDRSYFIG